MICCFMQLSYHVLWLIIWYIMFSYQLKTSDTEPAAKMRKRCDENRLPP